MSGVEDFFMPFLVAEGNYCSCACGWDLNGKDFFMLLSGLPRLLLIERLFFDLMCDFSVLVGVGVN